MSREMESDLALMDVQRNPNAVPLFMPYVTEKMRRQVDAQLRTRWIGQGPRVEEFESAFEKQFLPDGYTAIAVSSGTAALHIAYALALDCVTSKRGLQISTSVIGPIFTCTATNLPWLYLGCSITWSDVAPGSLNVNRESVAAALTSETRAISVVHYGGAPVDMTGISALAKSKGLPLIQDCAQALGAKHRGNPIVLYADFSVFSFQAIKHITTGDGGMLVVQGQEMAEKAKRLRWFGIDRRAKQSGKWANDISELGYKYQMTDIAAAMGIAALSDWSHIITYRQKLLYQYQEELKGSGVHLIDSPQSLCEGDEHAAWTATIRVAKNAERVRDALRNHGIESNPVHYRNDRYSVFQGKATGEVKNMANIDGEYLCLPLHMEVTPDDVSRICAVLRKET